mgnify:CR=1 FL=1
MPKLRPTLNLLGALIFVLSLAAAVIACVWYCWAIFHASGMEAVQIHYLGEIVFAAIVAFFFVGIILVLI